MYARSEKGMSYVFYNPNPKYKMTTDCVIRMLTKLYDITWEEAFVKLSSVVLEEYEMPSSNYIWEKYLLDNGFIKRLLPSKCPDYITVAEFTNMYSSGEYAVCTGTHVVAVVDGDYYDAWDSGNEVITYYFERR